MLCVQRATWAGGGASGGGVSGEGGCVMVSCFSNCPQRKLTNRDNFGRWTAKLPTFSSVNASLMFFFPLLLSRRIMETIAFYPDFLELRRICFPDLSQFPPYDACDTIIIRRYAAIEICPNNFNETTATDTKLLKLFKPL